MSQADYQALRVVRIRVSKLDPTTFAPLVGTQNGYVQDCQIQLQVSMNVTTGDSFEQKDGAGNTCGTATFPDRLKSCAISMDLCSSDPILRSFLTGGTLLTDPTHSFLPVGYQAPAATGTLSNRVCLEAWQLAYDGSTVASATSTGASAPYIHWVFPNASFVEDTTTLNNGFSTFPVKGVSVDNTAITANGPFNDWPIWTADNGGVTTSYGYFLDGTTLPTVTDARIAVPAGS